MVRSVLECGCGKAKSYAAVIGIDCETKLDLDDYGGDHFALWIGWPLAAKIEADGAALERLHSFLGAALQELGEYHNRPALTGPLESEAICE